MRILDLLGLVRKSDLTRRDDEISKLTKELRQLEDAYNVVQKQRAEMRDEMRAPRYFADVEKHEARKQIFLYLQSMSGSSRVYLQALVYNNKNKVKLENIARNLNRFFGHKDA